MEVCKNTGKTTIDIKEWFIENPPQQPQWQKGEQSSFGSLL